MMRTLPSLLCSAPPCWRRGARRRRRGAEEGPALPNVNWSFSGLFGTFDRAAAQRGFQVYNEVCSTCHSLKQAYYRNLAGIGLSEAQIKAIAASKTVPTLERRRPADRAAGPAVRPFPRAVPERQGGARRQ